MSYDARIFDPGRLSTFDVVHATDPVDLDITSRISDRLPASGHLYKYRLRDRALWGMRFDEPIFTMAIRGAGAIVVSYGDSRFATEVSIDGDEGEMFCVTMPLRGDLTLIQDGVRTTGTAACGLAFRPGPRTRLLISDDGVRANVFFKALEVEKSLEHMIDRRLRTPLEFQPDLDWRTGLLASLKRQLDCVLAEFQSVDGVAGNAVALASMTDLLVTLLLRGVRHTYTDQLEIGANCAVPAYVRRAEDFMRANGAEPIRIAQVAVAARCSVRTLNNVFKHFRGTTPLGALHAIRLEGVRDALMLNTAGDSITTVARRYGFTNLARFGAEYRRRFGEAPAEALRRASRA